MRALQSPPNPRAIMRGLDLRMLPTVTLTTEDSRPAGVLAVDDLSTFRDVVRELVQATPGMVVVGEASSGEQALELVEKLNPELVLMDVRMPGIGGVNATRKIKEDHPGTLVVLISTTSPEDLPAAAEECHADALLWKCDLEPHVLVELWQRHRVA